MVPDARNVSDVSEAGPVVKDLRRTPRHRVAVPFPCAFARTGLQRWRAGEKSGYGVVFDVSMKGARVMSAVAVAPGDAVALTLRLPSHPAAMNVDATVRWRKEHVFGVEFGTISHVAEMRLRRYLERA
ncbi:MAG TPA: PilZ domain-containing protein [Nitrospira sp.]|nr:PilZ domain-containing protein [Nitrospira sp.]